MEMKDRIVIIVDAIKDYEDDITMNSNSLTEIYEVTKVLINDIVTSEASMEVILNNYVFKEFLKARGFVDVSKSKEIIDKSDEFIKALNKIKGI